MLIKDVMTTDVDMIEPEANLKQAAKKMRDRGFGVLPVTEDGKLIGMVSDRDIVVAAVAAGKNPASTSVREVMSDAIYYCFEDQPLEDAAAKMGDRHVRRLPVLDRKMRLVGIVSLGDIASDGGIGVAAEALEQISSAP